MYSSIRDFRTEIGGVNSMTNQSTTYSDSEYLDIAREVFRNEASALQTVSDKIDATFAAVIRRLVESKGRLIVSGMGKVGNYR